jgi:hypothetical protein
VVDLNHCLNSFLSGGDDMVLDDIFQRFVQESPVSLMVRIAMENIFAASKLDAIFASHAKQQRSRRIAVLHRGRSAGHRDLPNYRIKIVDGNHLRRTERRLGELRNENVAPLPGQAPVVFDPRLRSIVDFIPCEDGHAQERRLMPEVLKTVEPKDLWIADRNFCTTGFLWGIMEQRGYFISMPRRCTGNCLASARK